MREILFRGKRIDNGEWVEGYYFCSRDLHREYNHKIHPLDSDWSYEIDPSTISEFTGLTDKNGKKIFEGDIIKHYFSKRFSPSVGQVMFDDKNCKWFQKTIYNETWELHEGCIYEVIGNIQDNLELLEDEYES